MRIKNFILSAILFTGVIFSFSGCGVSAETVVETAKKEIDLIESYKMQRSFDMELSSGEYSASTISDYTFDIVESPVYNKIEMKDIYDGEEVSNTMYIIEENGEYTAYMLYDSVWIKQSIDKEYYSYVTGIYDYSKNMKYLLDNADSYDVGGSETVNNVKCLKGTLTFNEETVSEVFNTLGVLDGLGLSELDGAFFEGLGNFEVDVFYDKETYLPVKYSFDVKEMLQNMVNNIYKEYQSEENSEENENAQEASDASEETKTDILNILKYSTEYIITDVNKVEANELPSEVKEAVDFEEYYSNVMMEYYSNAFSTDPVAE